MVPKSYDPQESTLLKSQEKGVLAKGACVESTVTAKEAKSTQGHRAQQYIWQSREADMFAKKPS